MRTKVDVESRSGFTLVELLVVISIIAVLSAISLRVIVGFVTLGREASTKTTVQKVARAIQSRHEAFIRRWGGNDRHTIARIHGTREWQDALQFTQNGGAPITDPQRLVLARKLLYFRAHPQSAADLTGPPWNLPAAEVTNLDNAEILYYIITRQGLFGPTGQPVARSDVAGPAISWDSQIEFDSSEVRDTDGDGNFEFVDSWGTPIRFWRYGGAALFHADIDGTGPQAIPHQIYTGTLIPLFPRPTNGDGTPRTQDYGMFGDQLASDQEDPLRLMTNVDNFSSQFHVPATAHFALVVSAGPDRDFGLTDSGDVAVPWANLDPNPQANITANLSQRMAPISDNIAGATIRAGGN